MWTRIASWVVARTHLGVRPPDVIRQIPHAYQNWATRNISHDSDPRSWTYISHTSHPLDRQRGGHAYNEDANWDGTGPRTVVIHLDGCRASSSPCVRSPALTRPCSSPFRDTRCFSCTPNAVHILRTLNTHVLDTYKKRISSASRNARTSFPRMVFSGFLLP